MTLFLGYTAICVVGEIFGGRSKTVVVRAPAAALPPMPAPAVAGMPSWGAPEGASDHPWLGGMSVGGDAPEPARVKFGPTMFTVSQGRHVAIVAPPAAVGTLSPAGLSSSDPSVLAPTTLPDGQPGFIAVGPGFATIHGQYVGDDGSPYNASVPIQIAGA